MQHREMSDSLETTIRTPALGQLSDVYGAITAGDEIALERMSKKALRKDEFLQTIHKSVGHGTFTLGMGALRPAMKQHAALWMLPMIVRPGFKGPTENSHQYQKWVHQCMGLHQTVSTLNVYPSISEITGLGPAGTYTLLETLLRLRQASDLPFDAGRMSETQPKETGLPTLQFMVGSAARINEIPSFPENPDYQFMDRLGKALHLQNAEGAEVQMQGVVAGMPEQFSNALVSGLVMLFDEIERLAKITGWTMDVIDGDSVRLTLAQTNLLDGTKGVYSIPVKLWQVGLDGMDRIKARCAAWPLKHSMWETANPAAKLS